MLENFKYRANTTDENIINEIYLDNVPKNRTESIEKKKLISLLRKMMFG